MTEIKPIIKIENCYSWLLNADHKTLHILWSCLRFKAKGYFFSPRYKNRSWDGYDNFFLKESGRFLTGLLPEIKAALDHLGVEYDIDDKRTNTVKFIHTKIDKNFLQQWNTGDKPFVLDDYQYDLPNQLIKHPRAVIFAPTGAGKTFILLSFLHCLDPKTITLILMNKKSLAEQNYNELIKWGFKDVGRLYDKYNSVNFITVATFQSLHKIKKILPNVQAIIVDEIHENMSAVPKKYYNLMKNASIRVAMSATPFKHGGTDKSQKYFVKGFFGPVLKTNSTEAEDGVLKTKKLQASGRLSQAECTFYPITEPELPYEIYQDAIERGIASNISFAKIVVRKALSSTGRTLILVERLAHGDLLKSLIPDAVWVQGKDDMETRQAVVKQLQSATGNVIGIATQGIFNTGLNVRVHNLINAASGQAEHVILQRFGRGLRTADDKDILQYTDFVFHINPYLLKHSKDRIRILRKEGHIVNVKDMIDF